MRNSRWISIFIGFVGSIFIITACSKDNQDGPSTQLPVKQVNRIILNGVQYLSATSSENRVFIDLSYDESKRITGVKLSAEGEETGDILEYQFSYQAEDSVYVTEYLDDYLGDPASPNVYAFRLNGDGTVSGGNYERQVLTCEYNEGYLRKLILGGREVMYV